VHFETKKPSKALFILTQKLICQKIWLTYQSLKLLCQWPIGILAPLPIGKAFIS